MRFDIPCVKNFLKENGFVFSVRSYNSEDSFVPVEGIGKCWRKKIKEIHCEEDLCGFEFLSGFWPCNCCIENIGKIVEKDKIKVDFLSKKIWWQTIEKFCKGKPKYLYLVVRVE